MRADLSGFTRMSETMVAEDVMAFLNEIFDLFSKIIDSYKGKIYQIIGDEVVSVFGFPRESDFAPHMAIFAAEDMLKELSVFNEKKHLKNPVGLKIGAAMDPSSIFNYYGDLHNASIVTKGFRKSQILQKNALENTMLVCENLYQVSKAFFSFSEVGEFVEDSIAVKAYEYKIR